MISACRALSATPSLTSKDATGVSFSFHLSRLTSIYSGASVARKKEIGIVLSNQVFRVKSLVPPHPQLPQCLKAISCVVVVRVEFVPEERTDSRTAKLELFETVQFYHTLRNRASKTASASGDVELDEVGTESTGALCRYSEGPMASAAPDNNVQAPDNAVNDAEGRHITAWDIRLIDH
jgi:hypothetical protein